MVIEEKPSEENKKKFTSINGETFKINTINYNKFEIGDTRNYSKYVVNGFAKLIKVPFKVEFKPYHEVYNTNDPQWDMNLM